MNRFELYTIYLKNIIYFCFKRFIYGNAIIFDILEIVGNNSSIRIRNGGNLRIGTKLMTRSNFNLLVDGGNCLIGDNCFFNHNCSITCLKSIVIGNRCTFGNNLVLIDHDHNYREITNDAFICQNIEICDGAWIGANVVILKGSKIGKNCVIASGSIVKGEIPDDTIYVQKREASYLSIINNENNI